MEPKYPSKPMRCASERDTRKSTPLQRPDPCSVDFGSETLKFRFEFCFWVDFLLQSFPKKPEKNPPKIPPSIHPEIRSEIFPSDFLTPPCCCTKFPKKDAKFEMKFPKKLRQFAPKFAPKLLVLCWQFSDEKSSTQIAPDISHQTFQISNQISQNNFTTHSSWRTFRIFFIFSARGRGRGSAGQQGGWGRFLLKIPGGGGGFPKGGAGREGSGRVFAGNFFGGGGG